MVAAVLYRSAGSGNFCKGSTPSTRPDFEPETKDNGVSKPAEVKLELILEKALDEFKETRRLAEEVNEKLRKALKAQKRAEKNSEIEKFREDLKLVLKGTNEKYESMLGDARREIDALTGSIEQSKRDHQNMRDEWEQRELHVRNSIKKRSSLKKIEELSKLLEEAPVKKHEEEKSLVSA